MSALKKLLLVLAGMVFLTLGFMAFSCYGHLDGLTKAAQATPQNLSLAELLEKGSGNNAHVRLGNFTFGVPVIEVKEGEWKGVWLTLEPATPSKHKSGPVVLWASRVTTVEELQELVKQSTLDLLCSDRLPDTSYLWVRPSKTFQAAHPKTDLSRVIVLVEPAIVLPEGTVLKADVLFDPRIPRVTGWVGLVSLILSGICLWQGFRSTPQRSRRAPVKENERPTPPPPAEAYARMAREPELSLHPFAWRLVIERMYKRGGILLFCLLGIAFFLFVGVKAIMDGQPAVFIFSVVVCAILYYCGLFLTFMSVGALLKRVYGFAVHPRGIRWQDGNQTHAALWEDIAEVYRAEVRCFSRGSLNNTFSTMKLRLYDGRVLMMSADTYGNFDVLADHVQSMHGGWIAAVKRHDLAVHGQASFGDVTVCEDGLLLHGRFAPWAELDKYEIENGSINFFHLGRLIFSRTSIALRSIPNSAAMISLLYDMPHLIRGRRKVMA